MKMGKRKEKMANQGNKRRQILQLDDEQENRNVTWQNINNNNVQRYEDAAPTEESPNIDPPRVNPLSGLLSHYMDCEDEESEDEEEINKSPKNDKPIDVEVADFLKEIDAMTAEETADKIKTEEKDNQWQECVDQSTGYTYYWNVVTNQVSWECPKDDSKENKINNNKPKPKQQQQQPPPHQKINLLPGFSNDYSSDEDADNNPPSPFESKSKPNPKMGPHLPTDDNNSVLPANGDSTNDKSKDPPLPPLTDPPTSDDPDATAKARRNKIKDLFLGPNVPQIFPPSLDDDESDNEKTPIPCPPHPTVVPYGGNLFPTQEGVSKHRGFGFSQRTGDGGKTSDKISFVKAETLDLNALNRIAASEWKGHDDAKNVVVNEEDDDIDVIDRELDLALARKVEKEKGSSSPNLTVKSEVKQGTNDVVEDDVVRMSNDILCRLTNVNNVNNLQRLLIQTQTRLEDWRQGALNRSYILTKLRQTEADVHRLVTQGDRYEHFCPFCSLTPSHLMDRTTTRTKNQCKFRLNVSWNGG